MQTILSSLPLSGSAQAQPNKAITTGHELRVLQFMARRDRDDIAVVWVGDRLELLKRKMQEAHYEKTNRQTVRQDARFLESLSKQLAALTL